jgi:hypothetical protein
MPKLTLDFTERVHRQVVIEVDSVEELQKKLVDNDWGEIQVSQELKQIVEDRTFCYITDEKGEQHGIY